MKKIQIGQVQHYYDKIKVAIIKITKGDLKVGDEIEISDEKGNGLSQKVSSMQIEHAQIDIAKAGDEFGLKVEGDVKAKSKVFKL